MKRLEDLEYSLGDELVAELEAASMDAGGEQYRPQASEIPCEPISRVF